jgi:hypothetical protein
MARSWTEKYIDSKETALGVVRWCCVKGCKWSDFRKKGPRGTMGRGNGFREGNKQRGRAIQHVKEAHPNLEPKQSN